jgi:hypothetical protein
MYHQSRILIISDIEPFITTQLVSIKSVGRCYNLREDEIDCFIDWVVNQILTDVFYMDVIHHYRHDIYLCIYSELKYQLTDALRRCISLSDLRILKGCQVKTLVNDKDLFITRRIKYGTRF